MTGIFKEGTLELGGFKRGERIASLPKVPWVERVEEISEEIPLQIIFSLIVNQGLVLSKTGVKVNRGPRAK